MIVTCSIQIQPPQPSCSGHSAGTPYAKRRFLPGQLLPFWSGFLFVVLQRFQQCFHRFTYAWRGFVGLRLQLFDGGLALWRGERVYCAGEGAGNVVQVSYFNLQFFVVCHGVFLRFSKLIMAGVGDGCSVKQTGSY